ncbi:hypothetical protein D3C86_2066760 [compost metagenome]
MQLADNGLPYIPYLFLKGQAIQKFQQLMQLHAAKLIKIPAPDCNLEPLFL